MKRILTGLKTLLLIFIFSAIYAAIMIIPYLFYVETGKWYYLIIYVVNVWVTAWMLGRDE